MTISSTPPTSSSSAPSTLADDFQQFLEDALANFDPTLDLSSGSPLQVKVIQPAVARFGTDPFATDIATFIRDRMLQEFPNLMADNGGQLEDLLSDPLQLMLEPFKREIQSTKTNQSVLNAATMANSEADALGANFFVAREQGNFASGTVRVFFSAPTTSRITTDKAFHTSGNLNFFPIQNIFITATAMLFNKSGNLFFVDVPVRAENPGTDYNVFAGDINAVDDVSGVVRVANLADFTDGAPQEDNVTYLGRVPQALTERSLVTKRGIVARVPNTFTGVSALQIVGAGEPGMNRDILTGTSQGYLFMSATCLLYGSWIFVNTVVFKDPGGSAAYTLQAGDFIRFQIPVNLDPNLTVYTAFVTDVFGINLGTTSEQYILILDRTITTAQPYPTSGKIAVLKPGIITISGVPEGISANIQVPDDTVHLGGHTDVFVRPQSDVELQQTLNNVVDAAPFLALIDLKVSGSSGTPVNLVESRGIPDNGPPPTGVYTTEPTDFVTAGVLPGDVLVIETGAGIAGTYTILSVGSPGFASDTDYQLRVDGLISASGYPLRGRIVRAVTVDLVSPKTPKLPFNTGSVNDLQITIGSNLFRFNTIDVQSFGVVVGDTIQVLTGLSAGTYTITAFDATLGGQGAIVDRPAPASGANLQYRIYTSFTGVTLPLVRAKQLELLDSSSQSTGITVPYGDAVDIRPRADFEGAGNLITVFDSDVFVMPDASGLWSGRSTEDGACNTGVSTTTINSATAQFDTGDVGRVITLEGAGVAGGLYTGTVVSITSATAVVVTPAVSTTVSGADLTLGQLANSAATPGSGVDARYSQKIASADGIIRHFSANGANPITSFEINLPPFTYNGKADTLLAFTTRTDTKFTADTAGTNETSDLAESSIGDTLVILDGPNAGRYLIKDIRKLEMWAKSTHGHRRLALVQVEPELPVDPIRTAMRFIASATPSSYITALGLLEIIDWATDFFNASGFWTSFTTQLQTSLAAESFTITLASIQALMKSLSMSGYSVGPAAKGILRLFFENPVTVQLFFDDNPTLFQVNGSPQQQFRLALDTPDAQIFPESSTPTPPTAWNRDAVTDYPINYPPTGALASVGDGDYCSLLSGSAFAKRGILAGDVFEFQPAINDLFSRGSMKSSFVCITQSGSNVVQLIMPPNPDNMLDLAPGQFLFIDSGPDIGAYTIVKVLSNFGSTPNTAPIVQVQLDRALSHDTFPYPAPGSAVNEQLGYIHDNRSFLSTSGVVNGCPAVLQTGVITFPTASFSGTVKIDYTLDWETADGGSPVSPWTLIAQHALSGVFANMAALLADFNGDSAFTSAGATASSPDGVTLLIQLNRVGIGFTPVRGSKSALRFSPSSTGSPFGPTFLNTAADTRAYGGEALVNGGTNRVYAMGFGLNATVAVGSYITFYAVNRFDILRNNSSLSDPTDDAAWLGTFQITATGSESVGRYNAVYYIELGNRTQPFPADETDTSLPTQADVRWVTHAAPTNVPLQTSGGGTEITDQLVRFRLYDSVAQQRTISFPWLDSVHPLLATSPHQIELLDPSSGSPSGEATVGFAHMAPYRVVRAGMFKISSTDLALQRDGALYYVDVNVVGYGPTADMNISDQTGLILAGRREIDGYLLQVADQNFTFSDQEKVNLILPRAILPTGSTPSLDNEIQLAGQNLQVTYNNAPLVLDVQTFMSSPLDRTVVANTLVRHFIPGYVFLDVDYTGGSDPSIVAQDLINYLNTIDPDDNTVHVDKIIKLIQLRTATDVTLPVTVIVLFHGLDRQIRAMRSQDFVGGAQNPLFTGVFKQAYFIAGPDTSADNPRPDGEQVFLVRS